MTEGITTRLPGIASHESSRPSQRPRNPAGSTDSSTRVRTGQQQARADGSAAPQPGDIQAVQQLAAELGTALNQLEGDFSVSVDRDSGLVVVRITDEVTGEIVKQIPPQELLEADRNMERIVGLLVDDRV